MSLKDKLVVASKIPQAEHTTVWSDAFLEISTHDILVQLAEQEYKGKFSVDELCEVADIIKSKTDTSDDGYIHYYFED